MGSGVLTGGGSAARWPAWYAPVGFVVAFATATIVGALVLSMATTFPGTGDVPAGGLLTATLLQDAILVATALFFATRLGDPVRAADFGLRPGPIRPTVKWVLGAAAAFFAFSVAYNALITPEGEQDTLDALGADDNALQLVLSGVLVVVVAPVVEEVFFRGFMYRALRNRFAPAVAITAMAAVFGAIHYGGSETLELLPLLAVLGALFCVLYERTGTLYAPIALHAMNNSLAFGVTGPDGAAVLAPLGLVAVLALCVRGLGRAHPG